MDKKTYMELCAIEDRLFDVVLKNYTLEHNEITHIWSELHFYLAQLKYTIKE